MEDVIYLDTHVVIWLYAGEITLFNDRTLYRLQNNQLLISPVVELELQYLLETKRILIPPDEIIRTLAVEIALSKCTHHFHSVIAKSLEMSWTRDPFDRIIVAQAAINHSSLLTKDATILSNYKKAFWN